MGILIKDLRYGAKSLLKRPGFSIVAVLSIALGIGVNTTCKGESKPHIGQIRCDQLKRIDK